VFNTGDSRSGSGVASLLLGAPGSGNIDNNVQPDYCWTYIAPWVQDDWKVTNRLTVQRLDDERRLRSHQSQHDESVELPALRAAWFPADVLTAARRGRGGAAASPVVRSIPYPSISFFHEAFTVAVRGFDCYNCPSTRSRGREPAIAVSVYVGERR
jgi:hypothetical protein